MQDGEAVNRRHPAGRQKLVTRVKNSGLKLRRKPRSSPSELIQKVLGDFRVRSPATEDGQVIKNLSESLIHSQ